MTDVNVKNVNDQADKAKSRKRGRPREIEDPVIFGVKISRKDRDKLNRKAKEAGMKTSAYVRHIIEGL